MYTSQVMRLNEIAHARVIHTFVHRTIQINRIPDLAKKNPLATFYRAEIVRQCAYHSSVRSHFFKCSGYKSNGSFKSYQRFFHLYKLHTHTRFAYCDHHFATRSFSFRVVYKLNTLCVQLEVGNNK